MNTEHDFSPYGRADCSVCGREMNLRKDGTLRHHASDTYYAGRRLYRCKGSGLPPVVSRDKDTA